MQQSKTLAAYYEKLRQEGASEPRLLLVLAGLHQLIPWLLQWHNEVDPEFGLKLGDFNRGHVREEARRLGRTEAELSGTEGL